MKRVCLSALFAAAVAVAATSPSFVSVEAAPPATPTFNKDVLPLLQKQCQDCHRPNSIAPMSFMTYKDTRPYARAIALTDFPHYLPMMTDKAIRLSHLSHGAG